MDRTLVIETATTVALAAAEMQPCTFGPHVAGYKYRVTNAHRFPFGETLFAGLISDPFLSPTVTTLLSRVRHLLPIAVIQLVS